VTRTQSKRYRVVLWAALCAVGCGIDDREPSVNDSSIVRDPTNLQAGAEALLQVASRTFNFAAVAIGGEVTGVLVVGNVGDQPVEALQGSIQGELAAEFGVTLSPECALLAGRSSCSVNLRFAPQGSGARSASLVITGTGAAPLEVSLRGFGGLAMAGAGAGPTVTPNQQQVPTPSLGTGPAQLFSDVVAIDFQAEVGAPNQAVSTITNIGGTTSGPLLIQSPADFSVDSTCSEPLAPGASCRLTVTFQPVDTVARSGDIVVTDGAILVSLAVTGRGQYLVTIARAGTGAGRVLSAWGIDCGASCSTLVDPGLIEVSAVVENGSDSFFSGWSNAGSCDGPATSCVISIEGSRTLTANFSAQTNNLIFLASEPVPANFGNTQDFDAHCNRLASLAGINDAAGNAYMAAVSGSESFWNRIPSAARGWVRMDGLPFGDRREDLSADPPIAYYPVHFSESGQFNYAGGAWTGTANDGTVTDNCNGWTSESGDVLGHTGDHRTLYAWLTYGIFPCNVAAGGDGLQYSTYCMGTAKTAPIVVPRFTGKRMWVTNTPYVIGSMTPDQKCQAERPPGVAAARAYLGYTGRRADELLDRAATYVRPDGQLVGTGAQIATANMTGIPWIAADGSTVGLAFAWTGTSDLSILPGAADTCSDWRDTGSTAMIGLIGISDLRAFVGSVSLVGCSDESLRLYCVEP
jgi:hypothetical protein